MIFKVTKWPATLSKEPKVEYYTLHIAFYWVDKNGSPGNNVKKSHY